MKRIILVHGGLALLFNLLLTACNRVKADARMEEPPPAVVEHAQGPGWIKVEHPELFPLAIASPYESVPELSVVGVVSADVARNVPVVSLASGRVVELRARLGDHVVKDQLLIRIQSSEIAGAFSDYRKAVTDETLARAALDRAKLLFDSGSIARKDLEVAVNAEGDAKVTVETAMDQLKVLGADVNHISPVVEILAPISGVITEQNVTAAGGVKTLDNSPNLFTITDLSRVWIVCDVYENDLTHVHLNDMADVRLNAYPGTLFQGRISDIGSVLDPNLRTAKARIEVENPGLMRLGMFARATFHGQQKQVGAIVPASAILHLHERDWAYLPHEGHTFRRVEVHAGGTISPGRQVVVSGIHPGDRVVRDALALQNTGDR